MSAITVPPAIIYLGLDVHQDSVTIAVLPADATAPTRIDKFPNDFGEYFALLEYKLSRRDVLDAHIAELVDWRRFASPRQLMASLGFVPREHSSGARARRGSITKAGNAHCRHVLVQAAWSYRLHPKIGPALAMRQRGQPASVTLHAWKAQQRLYTMWT